MNDTAASKREYRRRGFLRPGGVVLGPCEFFTLGPWPYPKDESFRRQRPRLPRFALANWHDAPPYGVKFRWMRFGGIVWLPRWYNRRRWLGA